MILSMMNTEMIFYTEIALLLSIFVFGLQWLKLEFERIVRTYEDRTDNQVFLATRQNSAAWQIQLRKTWWESYRPVEVPMFAPVMATA
jgi:hypothetical protein